VVKIIVWGFQIKASCGFRYSAHPTNTQPLQGSIDTWNSAFQSMLPPCPFIYTAIKVNIFDYYWRTTALQVTSAYRDFEEHGKSSMKKLALRITYLKVLETDWSCFIALLSTVAESSSATDTNCRGILQNVSSDEFGSLFSWSTVL